MSRCSEWRAAAHSKLSGTARSIVADFFEFLSLNNNDILLLIVPCEAMQARTGHLVLKRVGDCRQAAVNLDICNRMK
jgi:hypothetical protein